MRKLLRIFTRRTLYGFKVLGIAVAILSALLAVAALIFYVMENCPLVALVVMIIMIAYAIGENHENGWSRSARMMRMMHDDPE